MQTDILGGGGGGGGGVGVGNIIASLLEAAYGLMSG